MVLTRRHPFTPIAVCALALTSYSCAGDPSGEGVTAAPQTSALAATVAPQTSTLAASESRDISARPPSTSFSFQLSGGDAQVTYGATNGLPVLTYQNPLRTLTFTGSDIERASTLAGTIVSVFLERTVDGDSTTLSLFVPALDLGSGSSVPVQTDAVTTVHRFCFVQRLRCEGQLDAYGVLPLQGTATLSVQQPPIAGQ